MIQLQAQHRQQVGVGHQARVVHRYAELRFQRLGGMRRHLTLLEKTVLHFGKQFSDGLRRPAEQQRQHLQQTERNILKRL